MTITQCFSTVDSNNGGYPAGGSGGIAGAYTGYGGNTFIGNCYTTGAIGWSGGGIVGGFSPGPGGVVFVESCAAYGSIAYLGGGIYGAGAGTNTDINRVITRNCFSVSTGYDGPATITSGGGIFGDSRNVNGTTAYQNLYAANGAWSDTAANSALSAAIVANVWVDVSSSATNVPYRLLSAKPMNGDWSISYSPNVVNSRIRPIITSIPSTKSGSYIYSIAATSGTLPTTISLNSSTGVITCNSTTAFNCNIRVAARPSNLQVQ